MKLTTGCTTKFTDEDKEVIRNIVKEELAKQKQVKFTIDELAEAEVEIQVFDIGFGDGGFDELPFDAAAYIYVNNGRS